MHALKDYFTDGLLQIAIVLSLMRYDPDSLLRVRRTHPQQDHLQDVILGSLSAYTQTDFHTHDYWNGDYIHPKSIDHLRIDDIIRDVHALGDRRRYAPVRTPRVDAWLVQAPEPRWPLPVQRDQTVQVQNVAQPSEAENVGNLLPNTGDGEQGGEGSGAIGNPSFSSFFGSELTKEDIDLIDVLWRQDIDVGIGRDIFESGPHREVEKTSTHYLTNLTAGADLDPSDQTREDFCFHQLSSSFADCIVDNETGELVPNCSRVAGTSDGTTLLTGSGLTIGDLCQLYDPPRHQSPQQYNNNLDYSYGQGETFDADESLQFLSRICPETQNGEHRDGSSSEWNENNDWSIFNSYQIAIGHEDDFEMSNYQPMDDVLREDVSLSTTNHHLDDSFPTAVQHDLTAAAIVDDNALLASELASPTYDLTPSDLDSLPFSSLLVMSPSGVFNLTDDDIFLQGINVENSMFLTDNDIVDTASAAATSEDILGRINTNDLVKDDQSADVLGADESADLLGEVNLGDVVGIAAQYYNDDEFIQQLLQDGGLPDLEDFDVGDEDAFADDDVDCDWSSDSAVSSMASPRAATSEAYDAHTHDAAASDMIANLSDDDAEDEDGAMGGLKKEEVTYYDTTYYRTSRRSHQYDTDYESSHAHSNASCSSNETYPSRPTASTSPKIVAHNHTYTAPAPVGGAERAREGVGKEGVNMRKDKDDATATRSRDVKRAKALKLPFSVDDIIYLPVDEFTSMIGRHTLTEAQLQLVRDIRRRGKNKAAAQNCRKRKLEVIQSLEDEVAALRDQRDQLVHSKHNLDVEFGQLRNKFTRLQADLLRSLRDASGQSYDPSEYTLQRTLDGDIILVPRNNTASTTSAGASRHGSSNSRGASNAEGSSKKDRGGDRKQKRKD